MCYADGGPNDPPSAWSEILPGVFARLTIVQGDLGRNTLDVRVMPNARTPSAANHSRSGFTIMPVALMAELPVDDEPSQIGVTLEYMFKYLSGLLAYPEGRPAQALILVPGCCGIRG